jgi:hypothetical protein
VACSEECALSIEDGAGAKAIKFWKELISLLLEDVYGATTLGGKSGSPVEVESE